MDLGGLAPEGAAPQLPAPFGAHGPVGCPAGGASSTGACEAVGF